MRVLYFDLPLRAYQFGAVYEIRDARNKIIFNLSGSVPIDYTAKKQFGDLLKIGELLMLIFQNPIRSRR